VKCEIKLFAAARQFAGTDHVTLELAEGATVAHLRAALSEAQPALAALLPAALIAIDTRYAGNTDLVPAGAEIALIPPVSGG
jgi:molybdopterin converting factor subunit 1